ncbi:DUF4212 domain-containing protein [Duganella qianjiadongensis]|uniref:DUF4212 domain-containing protein n=1 Tax=Duganella qianjiadongensis TaxID=2692176 RepID=A0ABW9VQX7_9BURK|nr:DUF4212 domain-containing protein [Duganella qianjiadongensis]MYM41953.1 DUF4212 domain-containing protein [Duganella qianjiadongensis]
MDNATPPQPLSQPSAPVLPAAQARITRAQHWQRTRRLSVQLLLLWLVTGFGAAFFARELANLSLFGWPLSFYLAAQGSCLVYLGILAYYAWRMRRLDKAARVPRSGSKEPRP